MRKVNHLEQTARLRLLMRGAWYWLDYGSGRGIRLKVFADAVFDPVITTVASRHLSVPQEVRAVRVGLRRRAVSRQPALFRLRARSCISGRFRTEIGRASCRERV